MSAGMLCMSYGLSKMLDCTFQVYLCTNFTTKQDEQVVIRIAWQPWLHLFELHRGYILFASTV
jgi:hypothetical protein